MKPNHFNVLFPFQQDDDEGFSFIRHDRSLSRSKQHTIHTFPFRDLPILRSHVHPHFAIYDFGKKCAMFGLTHIPLSGNRVPLPVQLAFGMAWGIHKSWMTAEPPASFSSNFKADDKPGGSGGGSGDNSKRGPTSKYTLRSRSEGGAKSQRPTGSGESGARSQVLPTTRICLLLKAVKLIVIQTMKILMKRQPPHFTHESQLGSTLFYLVWILKIMLK